MSDADWARLMTETCSVATTEPSGANEATFTDEGGVCEIVGRC